MLWNCVQQERGICHLGRSGVQSDEPVGFIFPEFNDYVWGQKHGIVIVSQVRLQEQYGVSQVLAGTRALLHYLDKVGVQFFASQSGGGVAGGKTKVSFSHIRASLLEPKRQTLHVMCLLFLYVRTYRNNTPIATRTVLYVRT